MVETPLEKQLRIKTGSLKRIHKEYLAYVKEFTDLKTKVEQMESQNSDEYTLKRQQGLLEDSRQMLPNCQARLETAFEDLEGWIEENKQDESIQERLPEAEEIKSVVEEFLEGLEQSGGVLGSCAEE